MHPATRLRELIAKPGPLLAPGIYDCISAKVVEAAGYDAGFVSGAAVTASVLGYPDVGLQTMPEILNQVRNMARCVNIPLIVDIDTGYGNALNMMRAVREYEAAGVAGIFFEDQGFPKRCGHFEGKKIIPVPEMVVKIRAACEAACASDIDLIASPGRERCADTMAEMLADPARRGLTNRMYNLTGMPALTLPMGFGAGDLPIGLQLAAGSLREDLIYQAAAAYEDAAGWVHRRPPIN